jgi:hypothetical protein
MKSSAKYELPLLSRGTEWSDERIAKLTLAELKGLAANAERLGEPELATRCVAQMTVARREALAAAKAAPAKKKVVKKVAVVAPE